MSIVEINNLVKKYGDNVAVNDLSLNIDSKGVYGFLGPNGAGKSTTMNILTGYISSTSGTATINGIDIFEEPLKAKKNIGYLPEIPPLYIDMTVKDYLNFVYDLKKCKLPRKTHIKDVCDLVKITDVYDRIIKNLSKGYKQRVGLAQALIGNPSVLILDEPTVGLDPKQIIEIRTLIKKLGKKHTVILSSHILSEIQAVCDRVIIINNGKVSAEDTIDNLSKSVSGDHRLIMRIDGGGRKEIIEALRNIKGVISVKADMMREDEIWEFEIEAEEGQDIRHDINEVCRKNNYNILMMKNNEMTLEDIFLKITMGENVQHNKKNGGKN